MPAKDDPQVKRLLAQIAALEAKLKAKTGKDAASAVVAKGFTLPFQLQLAQAKAAATQATGDDLRVAKQIRAFVLKAIPHLGGQKLLDAYQELGQVNATLAGAVKTAAEKVKGFAVPLALQVAQARDAALGKDDALKKVLEKIKAVALKALKSGKLGFQGQLDAWNTIASVNDQLKIAGADTLSKLRHINTKDLVKGLGLTADQMKAIRARASSSTVATGQFVSGGAFGVAVPSGPTVVHTDINIDGRKVASAVTRHQQRNRRRNPQQRRGFAGAF